MWYTGLSILGSASVGFGSVSSVQRGIMEWKQV